MIELIDVSFQYEGQEKPAIQQVQLNIKQGEVVVLCGASGSGKSTILQLLNGIIPHFTKGKIHGKVTINGINTADVPIYKIAEYTGTVFQNPKSQFYNVDSDSELVFTSENFGIPSEEILNRKDYIVQRFGIQHLLNQSLFKLSGGEKQKIAAASVAIHNPPIILLDEPSSNLDAQTIDQLKDMISYWKSLGKTIVISEHRLYYLMSLADRFIYLKNGEIANIFTQNAFRALSETRLHELGLRQREQRKITYIPLQDDMRNQQGQMITSRYQEHLSSFNFDVAPIKIPSPSIYAIVGHNGAGKSTWISHLTGLKKKRKAYFEVNKTIYRRQKCVQASTIVMQDVNHQLFTESVEQEVRLSMVKDDPKPPSYYLELVNLEHYAERHPMSLSGGEKQRLAIATAIASHKSVYVFDEPTSGLDYKHMLKVAQVLKKIRDMNKQVLLITHDTELIEQCADGVIELDKGKLKGIYQLSD